MLTNLKTTRRQLYTMSEGTVVIGPGKAFGRFLKGEGYVRGRPTRVLLAEGPTGALTSYHIDDFLRNWAIASNQQITTLELLYTEQ